MLSQGVNLEEGVFFSKHFPVRKQLFAMDTDPSADFILVILINVPSENFSRLNIERCHLSGMHRMDVRIVVLCGKLLVHLDDDTENIDSVAISFLLPPRIISKRRPDWSGVLI